MEKLLEFLLTIAIQLSMSLALMLAKPMVSIAIKSNTFFMFIEFDLVCISPQIYRYLIYFYCFNGKESIFCG